MRCPVAPERVVTVGRLKRRADFLRASKGRRWHGTALSLQMIARGATSADEASSPDTSPPRVGFTLTKKVGCAVVRNRARRRLRAAVHAGAGLSMQSGHDYVVVGRTAAVRLPFEDLVAELGRALRAVDAPARPDKSGRRAGPRGENGKMGPKP